MLGGKSWEDFNDALAQAGGPDASADQVSVLKAMMLQVAGKVSTKGAYIQVIATFAGLPFERAKEELQDLATSGVIRYDPSKRLYTFWPAGKSANKVDQLLSEKLKGRILDDLTVDAASKSLRSVGLLNRLSIAIPWGHPDDWQAEQIVLTKTMFTAEGLQRRAISKLTWSTDGSERARGLVVW